MLSAALPPRLRLFRSIYGTNAYFELLIYVGAAAYGQRVPVTDADYEAKDGDIKHSSI